MKYYINSNSDNVEFTYIYIQSLELSKLDSSTTLYVYSEPQFCNTTVYRYDVIEISAEQYTMLKQLNANGDDFHYDEALNIIDSILYTEQ